MGTQPRTVPLAEALRIVHRLEEILSGSAQQVAASGSTRRGLPLVGDVDVIVVSEMAAVRQALDPYEVAPQPERPWVLSGTLDGVGFDAVVVAPESLGAAQAMVTGPADYRTFLEEHARSLGFDYSSAGLRETGTGRLIPTETEEALFARLGLPFLPPAERKAPQDFSSGTSATPR